MSSLRPTSVYVSIHEGIFLALCAECDHFVAASAELGSIAIATRAHRCRSRVGQTRKPPLKIDPAEHWLRAAGVIV